MEEVDKIILHSLRQIGCVVEKEISSLKQFDSDMIVKAAVSCLELIQPGLGLPLSLPQNMAAKYRIGQMIAQACVDNGFPGDIGYQTFLYSGEADVRKVLMFLIEKLPKEQEKFVSEPTGSELLLRQIKSKVKESLNKVWLPNHCNDNSSKSDFLSYTNVNNSSSTVAFKNGSFRAPDKKNQLWLCFSCMHLRISRSIAKDVNLQSWKEFCMNDLPSNFFDKKYLVPTIINLHSRGCLLENNPKLLENLESNAENIAQPSAVSQLTKEPVPRKSKPPVAPRPNLKSLVENKKDEEKEKLMAEEESLTKEVEELMQRIQQLKLKKQRILQEMEKDELILVERREKDSVRTRILELLPDGENNVLKLQQVVEAAAQKLISLAAQWEKHRVPLIEKYRENMKLQSNRMNEHAKKAETAKSLGEKRKELELELKNKEQILAQLQSESQKNGKEVNRSAYTRRIMEIINNIEKQRTEIEKVLKDTRDIQKEINALSGQLDRSFTVADEIIFRDAKKDETSRKAYKLLATLHTDCDQLVAMVQETGGILREIRDLEDQIEKEKSKNISANLERITADLNQMKVESAQIANQLKLKEENS